jgi:hypothetical protein
MGKSVQWRCIVCGRNCVSRAGVACWECLDVRPPLVDPDGEPRPKRPVVQQQQQMETKKAKQRKEGGLP